MFLDSDEMREGIKKFSNWPTIPQLYVKEEFIGGCDIVKEMYENGELQELFNNKGIKIKTFVNLKNQIFIKGIFYTSLASLFWGMPQPFFLMK